MRRASARAARALSLAAALPLAGCATVFQPSTFEVPIDSVPPGAAVTFQGKPVGVTPCVLRTARTIKPVVSLDLDGHHSQTVEVGNTPAPIGLVILDGLLLLPILVDVATMADWCVDDRPILVHLTPAAERPPIVWRREDHQPAK